jgi:hypothetical protein
MANHFQAAAPHRFEAAIRRFDEENAKDPNQELIDGMLRPRELVYAQWLTEWVLRLSPEASEELRLAARCQHVCRWMLARNSYPLTRQGYLQWREALKRFHAQKAGEILLEVGYPPKRVARVQELNLKKGFPHDPEGRVLEDALCLVFLEHQFGSLSVKTSDEKMINALQKSWAKMTPFAQTWALRLPYKEHEKALLDKALVPTC